MSEILLDQDAVSEEWVRPDEKGFTIRTRYRGTDQVLDRNARLRADTPTNFKGGLEGSLKHVGSIPIEVYEQMTVRLGREPTANECLDLLKAREYSKLKTREVKL